MTICIISIVRFKLVPTTDFATSLTVESGAGSVAVGDADAAALAAASCANVGDQEVMPREQMEDRVWCQLCGAAA